jgi:hypothetical protein
VGAVSNRDSLAVPKLVTPQPHDFDQDAQWMLRHRRRANEGHIYRPLLKLAQMFWTGPGERGGEIVFFGKLAELLKCNRSRTGQAPRERMSPRKKRSVQKELIARTRSLTGNPTGSVGLSF